MNNNTIIANIAISEGLMTKEEVERTISAGGDIPLHSVKYWNQHNFKVKQGEHGIEARLWKKRKTKKNNESDDTDSIKEVSVAEFANKDFYLTKTFLFWHTQVQQIENGEQS